MSSAVAAVYYSSVFLLGEWCHVDFTHAGALLCMASQARRAGALLCMASLPSAACRKLSVGCPEV